MQYRAKLIGSARGLKERCQRKRIMHIINRIAAFHDDMTAWRRDLHAHPETAFEEHRTAALIAEKLRGWGVEVHEGLAKTGVVGTLRCGSSTGAIGLRADMDALPMEELNDFVHRSVVPGKFHGCGHDGHTSMLLGAARYLAETRNFDGTVHFIFQPAEENVAGAGVMISDGLFEKFPVAAVYGMHNRPNLPAGEFAMQAGPALAAADNFGITLRGRGTHAAWPHLGIDLVVVGSQIVLALQTIVSRQISPLDSAVVSVTLFQAGSSNNVIADKVRLRGTARSFSPAVQDRIEQSLRDIAHATAAMHGATAEVEYERRYPALHNDPERIARCAEVARSIVGNDRVDTDHEPGMGSDDFSFMSNRAPGAYVWIGSGPVEAGSFLHNPRYDFNDAILSIGASYWARLVEAELPRKGSAP
jgi:amidohydrolase